MYTYSVNVAQHNRHFCRIQLDLTHPDDVKARFNAICERFPASDGFHLTLRRQPTTAEIIAYSEGA